MLSKPPACSLCRLSYVSLGYSPNTGNPATTKLAIVLDSPSRSDILDEGIWAGGVGKWNEGRWLTPVGLKRSDVLFSSVIRCKPPKGDFPDGTLGKFASDYCRRYDQPLVDYAPTVAIVTFGLQDVAKTPALTRLVGASIERAMRFQSRGHKPVLLMGDKAAKLCFPWMTSGVKKWFCHYLEIDGWPFKGVEDVKTLDSQSV